MKKYTQVIACIIVSVAIFVAGCCFGRFVWKDKSLNQTYYAKITSIDKNEFMVQGLAVNDINHRGSYRFVVTDKTLLYWRGVEIKATDLLVDDIISITYSGVMLEISPAFIQNVETIWLLSDR